LNVAINTHNSNNNHLKINVLTKARHCRFSVWYAFAKVQTGFFGSSQICEAFFHTFLNINGPWKTK